MGSLRNIEDINGRKTIRESDNVTVPYKGVVADMAKPSLAPIYRHAAKLETLNVE